MTLDYNLLAHLHTGHSGTKYRLACFNKTGWPYAYN